MLPSLPPPAQPLPERQPAAALLTRPRRRLPKHLWGTSLLRETTTHSRLYLLLPPSQEAGWKACSPRFPGKTFSNIPVRTHPPQGTTAGDALESQECQTARTYLQTFKIASTIAKAQNIMCQRATAIVERVPPRGPASGPSAHVPRPPTARGRADHADPVWARLPSGPTQRKYLGVAFSAKNAASRRRETTYHS